VSNAFVAVLVIELHFPDVASLKGKRAELAPLKAHLHKLGASVAEVDHQDLWQRATLAAAVVGSSARHVETHVAAITDWIDGRFPQGAGVERTLASWEDLVGIA
jgi:uncharacterized protein YlxP (DUF503 family)